MSIILYKSSEHSNAKISYLCLVIDVKRIDFTNHGNKNSR